MRYWIETTSGQQSLLSGKSIEEERTNQASSEQKAGKLLAGPVFTYFQQQLNSAVLYLGYFSYSTCYLVNLWTIITISSSKNIFFWLASWYINLSQINHLLFKLRYRCFPDSAGSSSPVLQTSCMPNVELKTQVSSEKWHFKTAPLILLIFFFRWPELCLTSEL